MPTEYDWRNGQDRTRWLYDMLDAYVADPINYYLGPTGIPERAQTLGRALEYTDAGDYLEATNAGRALWDDPGVGNALRAAGAMGAAAIPIASAKMVNDGVDVAGDAWRSLQDDWGKFWADEDGALALGREPETPAQEVARLLREGGEVTEEIYGRLGPADHMELTDLYNDPSAPTGMYLPQDEASRMARAREMGHDVDRPLYHGSTREITGFDVDAYPNPGNAYGPGIYTSTSIDDVNLNYAGEGADLTNRIQREIELSVDGMDDWPIIDWWAERGVEVDDIDDLTGDQVEQATARLARDALGIENQGVVYPLTAKVENPVVVGGPNETTWDFQTVFDDAGEEILGEEGSGIDLINAARNNWMDIPAEELSPLEMRLIDDGEISSGEMVDALEGVYGYDDMGELFSPGGVANEIWKEMGHDAVDMDATVFRDRFGFGGVKMPGMGGITDDTRHLVLSKPENIRSRFAHFDPRLRHLRNLSAALAPLALYDMGQPAEDY